MCEQPSPRLGQRVCSRRRVGTGPAAFVPSVGVHRKFALHLSGAKNNLSHLVKGTPPRKSRNQADPVAVAGDRTKHGRLYLGGNLQARRREASRKAEGR